MVKLVSVNVGLPREVIWKGKPVTTGFFKAPVAAWVVRGGQNRPDDLERGTGTHREWGDHRQ
jgi:hypothetical protein